MSVLRVGCIWVSFAAAYGLFAGQLSLTEAMAGVPAAAIVTVYVLVLRRRAERPLRLQAPWFRLVGQVVVSVPVDAVRVGRVLLRALVRRPDGGVGRLMRQPFRQGGEAAGEAGRRGLVSLAASVAANGFMVEIPARADAMVVHRLVDVPAAADQEWSA